MNRFYLLIIWIFIHQITFAQTMRLRDFNVKIGVLPTGKWNTITDVAGVKVGQITLNAGDSVRTGVTAIFPHDGNVFQQKVLLRLNWEMDLAN